MAKKRGNKRISNERLSSNNLITLREEATGLKPTRKSGGAAANPKNILKLQHLQQIAEWASGEASIPVLGAFFGRRFAAVGESLGVPPDPYLFSCQRCETILRPGHNCTVRIEKNRAKTRHRRKKPRTLPQNHVVYRCHFCSHSNLKRGTPKGHMKDLYPTKVKVSSKSRPVKSVPHISIDQDMVSGAVEINQRGETSSSVGVIETPVKDGPSTPLTRTLLDGNKRKRNRSGAKKPAEPGSTSADAEAAVGGSSKKRRKSWISLREIAESSGVGAGKNVANLKIPFPMK